MNKYGYGLLVSLMSISGMAFAVAEGTRIDAVKAMIRKGGNWNRIFKAINTYSINPATFVVDNINGKNVGILYFVVEQARKYTGAFEDNVNPESSRMEAIKALNILAVKYRVFKGGTCGIDDCNTLFELALGSNTWGSDEPIREPSLDVVDLLLKYGAKGNRKIMAYIKKARDGTWAEYEG